MNLVEVEYADGVLRGEGFRIDASPWGDALAGHEGRHVVLGVRPEHLALRPAEDGDGTLCGDVYSIEPLGPESLVTLEHARGFLVVRIFGDDPPDVPDRVGVGFAPEHLHLFDAASGERLG